RRARARARSRPLERHALADREGPFGEDRRDPLTRLALAVNRLVLVRTVLDLRADRSSYPAAVVVDVDDVRAPVTPLLPWPDVHRGHADERALADCRARVPDDARRLPHQL